jgi:hypothetical protein
VLLASPALRPSPWRREQQLHQRPLLIGQVRRIPPSTGHDRLNDHFHQGTWQISNAVSDDREGAGLGVRRQKDDCRLLAASLGWTVVELYDDNDMSASNRRKKRKG